MNRQSSPACRIEGRSILTRLEQGGPRATDIAATQEAAGGRGQPRAE